MYSSSFTAVSGSFAKEYAPQLVKDNGPYVIDNSSAFRYDDDIPLVVRPSTFSWLFHFGRCYSLPSVYFWIIRLLCRVDAMIHSVPP